MKRSSTATQALRQEFAIPSPALKPAQTPLSQSPSISRASSIRDIPIGTVIKRSLSTSDDDDIVCLGVSRKGCKDDPIDLDLVLSHRATASSSFEPPSVSTTRGILCNITGPDRAHGILPVENAPAASAPPPYSTAVVLDTAPSGTPSTPLHDSESIADTDVTLSRQQQDIVQSVVDGNSVLIHGSAGTGKSVVIRAIVKRFGDLWSEQQEKQPGKYPSHPRGIVSVQPWRLAATAPTGVTAM